MYSEETAGPGLWKASLVGLAGLWLIAAAFIVPPGPAAVYNYRVVGAVATIAGLMMSGNRQWERPLATGFAMWLFISGFVPSVWSGRALRMNDLIVAVALIVAAISAHWHLRDDVRHHRPLAM